MLTKEDVTVLLSLIREKHGPCPQAEPARRLHSKLSVMLVEMSGVPKGKESLVDEAKQRLK